MKLSEIIAKLQTTDMAEPQPFVLIKRRDAFARPDRTNTVHRVALRVAAVESVATWTS